MEDESESSLETVYHTLVGNRTRLEAALAKSRAMEVALIEAMDRFQLENLNVIELELQIAQQQEMTARLFQHLIEVKEELKKYSTKEEVGDKP